MGISTSTGTLTAGNSRTFNLSPASAVTLTLSPNVRVTITETPATVAATGLGGNASRVHEPRLPGVVTYGPYPMGGSVLVEVESNSGSSVGWVRSDSIVAESADGAQSLVAGGGKAIPGPIRTGYAQSVLGTFGDSIANISSFANHDLRQISGSSMGSNSDRMGVALNALANGGFRISFNGGVSGETTTQMLARDAAGGSATRKAITDAATLGIKHLVLSAGINDLQNPTLPAGSSSAVIDAAVAASIVNLVKLCQRAMAMGITPHVPALLGYRYAAASGLATNSQANVATTQEAIRRWNVLAKATFVSAGTGLGYFYDSFVPSIVDGNGAWLAGLDQGDGLHPSENSTYLIYGPVAQNILFLATNLIDLEQQGITSFLLNGAFDS